MDVRLADTGGMETSQRSHGHPSRILVALVLASLGGCEAMQRNWERNAAYWNSPQGQAATLQAFQQQQAVNQQNYQFEQTRLLRQQQMQLEYARSMQPIDVRLSGSVDVHHSGTVRVRR